MEFTKDLMFHIKYEQDENVVKINKIANKKRGLFERGKYYE